MSEIQNRDDICHSKARKRNQRTFTLVEQDASFSKSIVFWILLNIETCPAPKLRDALETAIEARTFPKKKTAD